MRIHADTLLVRLQYLMLVGIVITQVLGKTSISSLLFTLTFVFTACLWMAAAWRNLDRTDVLALWIVLISCICVSVNALIAVAEVSFSYFKKLIMFCCTVLLFAAMRKYRPKESDIQFVFRLNTILIIFLTAMYVWQKPQMHLLNQQITDYLTFRFTNPNLTGVFLSAICMIELIHSLASRRKWARALHGMLACIAAYFVYETRARNAQLLLLVFLIIFLILRYFPKFRLRMTLGLASLIAVFPLIFALAYLLLIHTPAIQSLFSFLIGAGKDLDSRVGIWNFALDAFVASPLFGAYSEISQGTGLSQMHNSHLDILASYGCITLALLCAFLLRLLCGGNTGRVCFLCQIGFAALLLSGIGEAVLFSGGMGIYLYSGVFLMLANFHFESEGQRG